jgi:hypothetical protein
VVSVLLFSLMVTSLVFAGAENAGAAAPSAVAKPSDLGASTAPDAGAESGASPAKEGESNRPFRMGVGVRVSTLGIGLETATSLNRHANVRMGINGFSYSPNLSTDGIKYAGTLAFRSAETHFDWFPFRNGFHISPGLLYNDNRFTANGAVPVGQTFTLNHVDYVSSAAGVAGTGRLQVNKFDPSLLLGWGNLVPRRKHFSISVEGGAAYQGVPRTTLGLTGNVCDPTGANCRAIASDPTVQSNIVGQQNKVNGDLKAFRFYPIVSVGFGYRF